MSGNFGLPKVALAQVKSEPGQIKGNVERVLQAIERAKSQGADLVVFPELVVPGYYALDLFHSSEYVNQNIEAVKFIAKAANGISVLVGFASWDSTSMRAGNCPALYNSAAFLQNGKIVSVHSKSLLPEYGIFQEARYFLPASKANLIALNGKKIGIQICEDLWSADYQLDHAAELVAQGAELIVNLSASPFELGKFERRKSRVESVVKRLQVPYVYTNLVGSYDGYEGEVVFDGRSFVLNSCGDVILQAKAFKEELLVCDFEATGERKPAPTEAQLLTEALVLGIKSYFERLQNISGWASAKALVGLSGGIDSAVVLALAVQALGADRVKAVNLATVFNSAEGIEDCRMMCERLGVALQEINIHELYENFKDRLSTEVENSEQVLAQENLQARLRMIVLMYFANAESRVVLNTGNKTELALDNCTIYGDMLGALAVLGDIDKDRVYSVAEYINQQLLPQAIPQRIIDRVPTAELKPNQIDAHVMGDDPRKLGPIVRDVIENQLTLEEAKVRYSEVITSNLVDRIFGRIENSEWKRRQAPPAIRVTSCAFGVGRRMPMLHGFRG
jgi:NAD+ synthase (glutamine-hydrolysing)